MNVSAFLPLFMTMASPAANQDQMFQLTLPSILPVSKSIQGAITAMTASNIATQHSLELNKLSDEIVDFVSATDKGAKELSDSELNRFPVIKKYKLSKRIIKRFEHAE